MNIAISGASGFIGTRLNEYLTNQGHVVSPIGKELLQPTHREYLQNLIDSSDVVINLAGAPIDKRWSKEYKKILLDSRILTTHAIVEAINNSKRVKLLISTSAAGYDPSEECDTSNGTTDDGRFLATLCHRWEAEAMKTKESVRLVIMRLGIVFARKGGALQRMISTKSMGFVVRIGSPKHIIQWISLKDTLRAIEYIIHTNEIRGAVNFVAPNITTQREFINATKKRYRVPFTIPIPLFLLRAIYGEAAQVITQTRCAAPKKLLDSGFVFYAPIIELFYEHI